MTAMAAAAHAGGVHPNEEPQNGDPKPIVL
jgi:hypothetical protein